MPSLDLSIIIVNWHSAEFLRSCLSSIFSVPCNLAFEVLVVDNGSFDGCAEMVQRHFPEVRFVQLPGNLGFARASNLAFALSGGRNLLFLNPDTEMVGGALQRMRDVLVGTADAGIVGPRLVNPDLSIQPTCMRCFPAILNQLLDSSLSRRLWPRFWGFDVVARKSPAPMEAEVVPGTCLMVRRDLFAQAGFFNKAYFMYAEDIDLCCKIQKLGWKIYYLHDAVVIHHAGQSSRLQHDPVFSAVLQRESMWTFLAARRGRTYAAAYAAATALAAASRLLLCSVLWLAGGQHRRSARAATLRKWMRILRWCLGLELWARSLNVSTSRTHSGLPLPLPAASDDRLRA